MLVGAPLTVEGSGVGRFNAQLAQRLGIEVLSLADAARVASHEALLISVKPNQLPSQSHEDLRRLLRRSNRRLVMIAHEPATTELGMEMLRRADAIVCLNREVAAQVEADGVEYRSALIPPLLPRSWPAGTRTVFSFGMSHKLHLPLFEHLAQITSGESPAPALLLSTRSHALDEGGDGAHAIQRLTRVFEGRCLVLGDLPDPAVSWLLSASDYFAAFFPKGVRDNNTTVLAAMAHGAVVITNLDEHSPSHLVHGINVLDIMRIERLPQSPRRLDALKDRARDLADNRTWADLVGAVEPLLVAEPRSHQIR